MPQPKKQMSSSRSRKRRSIQHPDTLQIAKCAKCGRPSVAHRVHKACALAA